MFKKRLLSILLVTVVLFSGISIAYWTLRPPVLSSENGSDNKAFSQMMTNIKAMSQHPHPSGSQELGEVRAYLLAQLDAMGVKYEVQKTVCSLDEIAEVNAKREGGTSMPQGMGGEEISVEEMMRQNMRNEAVFDENDNLTLYNILVKLDAPDTDSGLLFTAHYDSVPEAPGASDDMTGVCALLEAVGRYSQDGNLKNDLYFLFTDGEELGSIGAKSFVRDNPEFLDNMGLVVNLDTYGSSGGLLMFETSVHNFGMLKYFNAASSHPLAYSWLSMAYHNMMSSGTDLTQFLNAGYAGLNFAAVGGKENHHSPTDDIDHLDRGTAYNFMQTAFEISDYSARVPLGDNGSTQDGVYFSLLPGLLVLIGDTLARILAGIAVLAALVWLIWQWRKGCIKPLRVLTIAGLQLGIMAAAALFGKGASMLIQKAGLFRLTEIHLSTPVFLCISVVIGAGAFIAINHLTRKRILSETLAGVMLPMILLTFASAIFFNAMSYLFTLPLLGLLIVGLLEQRLMAKTIAATLTCILMLLLYVPVCWLLYTVLGFKILAPVMAIAAIPITLICVMLWKQGAAQTQS